MKIAVYDRESLYAQRLVKFMMMQEGWEFAAAFTDKEQLLRHCREYQPDLLLTAEELYEEDLASLAKQVIKISEKEVQGEGEGAKLYRYQAADEILKEIHYLCGDSCPSEKKKEGDAEVYCVYSPAGHPMQSLFAWNFAKMLGEEKVLYVNLQENAAFKEIFEREYQRDLSDLLYLNQHRKGEFSELLRGILCEEDGLKYLPPMQNSADAFLLGKREWEEFFDCLISESGFSVILVDIGMIFPGFWQLLQRSRWIYEPILNFDYSKSRQREFDRLVEWKYPALLKRMKKVQLPAEKEELREHSSLTRSNMQVFARKLLKEATKDGYESGEATDSGADYRRGSLIS
jgi:hypothetical protein